jgi:hypothetical protein
VTTDGTVAVSYYDLRDSISGKPNSFDPTVWLAHSLADAEFYGAELCDEIRVSPESSARSAPSSLFVGSASTRSSQA